MFPTTVPPSSAPSLQYPVKRYSAEGGFRTDGLLRLLIALSVAGIALGVATHFVAKLIYLVLIFPALIGVCLGALGTQLVKSGHIRDPWLGAGAGFLGGVFAMFVMHYASYYEFRGDVTSKVPAEVMAMSDADLATALESTQDEQETIAVIRAAKSFTSFMGMQARQGVRISNHGGSPMNIGYYGSLIYWLIEILVVAGIALSMMYESASAPYCTQCETWKEHEPLAAITGDKELAAAGVKDGDPSKIAASGPVPNATGLRMLYRALCPKCGGARSPVDVKLMEFIPQKKGEAKKKTLAHASWPGEALSAIEKACSGAASAPITQNQLQ
jgi:hypothetical protein